MKQTVSKKIFYVKKEIYFTTGSICTQYKLSKETQCQSPQKHPSFRTIQQQPTIPGKDDTAWIVEDYGRQIMVYEQHSDSKRRTPKMVRVRETSMWKIWCDGFNENVLHRLTYLNTGSTAGNGIWGDSGAQSKCTLEVGFECSQSDPTCLYSTLCLWFKM